MKIKMPDGEMVENKLPTWKTPHNHDTDFESRRTSLYCPEPTLTKQEFKEETDINVILQRFLRTGTPPDIVLPEHFADLTNRQTYYDAAQASAEASQLFYLLPAKQRAEFQNDPTRWADAVVLAVDQGDRKALAALGVSVPKEQPQEPPQTGNTPAGSPAPAATQAAPGAPESGESPKPPSDKGK